MLYDHEAIKAHYCFPGYEWSEYEFQVHYGRVTKSAVIFGEFFF